MTKVYSIKLSNPVNGYQNGTFREIEQDANQPSACLAMELEKSRNKQRSDKRSAIYEKLVSGRLTEKVPIRYAFYGLSGILLSLLVTAPFSLIPVHNIFEHSEYWFELYLQAIMSFVPMWVSYLLFTCTVWMNTVYINKTRSSLILNHLLI